MKAKYALIALLAITFWGCDDNTAGLGLGMFPESDRDINGKLSTFDVTTESVHAGKIYAMTNVGYVGKFTDETFGTYQADAIQNIVGGIDSSASSSVQQAFGEINASKTSFTGPFQGIYSSTYGVADGGGVSSHMTGFSFDASRSVRTADETRMKNIALYPVIRIK